MNSGVFPTLIQKATKRTFKFFTLLKKTKPDKLDSIVRQIHEDVFDKVDCLKCANCCKTTSPVFYKNDIERLSKFFQIKSSQFIEKYLHIDEDQDYVLNVAPCPFLGNDNYCSVYELRPTACKEYPHTNRKRFYQILDITLKNTAICPAAFQIVEMLKQKMNFR